VTNQLGGLLSGGISTILSVHHSTIAPERLTSLPMNASCYYWQQCRMLI